MPDALNAEPRPRSMIQIDHWRRELDAIHDHLAYVHYCCGLHCAERENSEEDRIISREVREAFARLFALKELLGWDCKTGSYGETIKNGCIAKKDTFTP